MKRLLLLILAMLTVLCSLSPAAFASGEKNVPDPDTLAADYLRAVSGQHPNLLYTEEELPVLREKLGSGVSAMAYSAMKTLAEKYFSLSAAPYRYTGSGISGRALQLHVATLTFCGEMMQDSVGQKYIDHAVKILVSAAEVGSLAVYRQENDALCVGDFGCAYAIGYDWLYDYMTDEQRKTVYDEMTEIGQWLYTASTTGKVPGTGEIAYWAEDSAHRSAWNWNTVAHTALGMISMATGEHPEWLARSVVRLEAYLKHAKNADGLPYEGLSYTGYGMRMLVIMDASFAAHTGVSLIDAYPDVQNFTDYLMWATLPGGKEALTINQSNDFGNISVLFYLASRYGQAEGRWAILRAYGLEKGKVDTLTNVWAGNGFDLPQLVVFENKELQSRKPESGGMKIFGTEEVLMRSGFGDAGDSLVSLRIRAGHPSIWHHMDCGSVTFHALGQSFIIDLGVGSKEANQHNGLLINGKGTGDATKAKLLSAEEITDGVYLASVDLAPAYTTIRPKSCVRTLLFADGETPYIFVFDQAGSGGRAMTGTSNWYVAEDAIVKQNDKGTYIKGSGKSACYVYAFASGDTAETAYVDKLHAIRVTQADAAEIAAGVLFAATEDAAKAPEVTCAYGEDGSMEITVIRRGTDGAEYADSITASASGVRFATEKEEPQGIPETSADTTAVTEVQAETTAVKTDTAEKKETVPPFWIAIAAGVGAAMVIAAAVLLKRKKK